mmetsp:Transcript_107260/g.300347  ORF Transcript_107260/g.300347 Transcript_107260/m.300347 type:complete len:206 (-) Transcript_107260:19-636(-)
MTAPIGMESPKVKMAGRRPTAAPTVAPVARPVAPPAVPRATAPPVAAAAVVCTLRSEANSLALVATSAAFAFVRSTTPPTTTRAWPAESRAVWPATSAVVVAHALTPCSRMVVTASATTSFAADTYRIAGDPSAASGSAGAGGSAGCASAACASAAASRASPSTWMGVAARWSCPSIARARVLCRSRDLWVRAPVRCSGDALRRL